MEDDNILEFNFWPSFTDLMLSLVLVMSVVIFVVAAVISAGTVDIKRVEKSQGEVVAAIESEANKAHYSVSMDDSQAADITITRDLDRQKITFSEHILFQPDMYDLTPGGQTALSIVGNALKEKIALIREIQIQGHADIEQTTSHRPFGNLQLASFRAMRVFEYLKDNVKIDPAEHLMSATSFGEYSPISRQDLREPYNRQKLEMANNTIEQKGRNRRIELLVFYKN